MAIFVPPTIFAEVQTVFDTPVISDVFKNVVGCDGTRIKAGDEIPFVIEHNLAVISGQLTINSYHDFTIGYRKCFSNVISVL